MNLSRRELLASGATSVATGLPALPASSAAGQSKAVRTAERLVGDLERDLAVEPKDVELPIKLARLPGMAYARKTESVHVVPYFDKREEVYYGHDPDLIPYKPEAVHRRQRDAIPMTYRHDKATMSLEGLRLTNGRTRPTYDVMLHSYRRANLDEPVRCLTVG